MSGLIGAEIGEFKMKISKKRLRQIILEEWGSILEVEAIEPDASKSLMSAAQGKFPPRTFGGKWHKAWQDSLAFYRDLLEYETDPADALQMALNSIELSEKKAKELLRRLIREIALGEDLEMTAPADLEDVTQYIDTGDTGIRPSIKAALEEPIVQDFVQWVSEMGVGEPRSAASLQSYARWKSDGGEPLDSSDLNELASLTGIRRSR